MNDDVDQKPPPPENTGPEQAITENKGQFPPGKSGNPAGKPPGARNRATILAEKLLDEEVKQITDTCITMAKAGDTTALRLCMERLLPVRKGRPVRIDLSEVSGAADIVEAHSTILAAVASGHVTLEEASLLAGLIDSTRKAIETEELAREIEELKLAMKVK